MLIGAREGSYPAGVLPLSSDVANTLLSSFCDQLSSTVGYVSCSQLQCLPEINTYPRTSGSTSLECCGVPKPDASRILGNRFASAAGVLRILDGTRRSSHSILAKRLLFYAGLHHGHSSKFRAEAPGPEHAWSSIKFMKKHGFTPP